MGKIHPLYRHAKRHHAEVVKAFRRKHKHIDKALKTVGLSLDDVRHHAIRTVGLASIASSALVGPAYARTLRTETPPPDDTARIVHATNMTVGSKGYGPDVKLANRAALFGNKIDSIVPHPQARLTLDQEEHVQNLIHDTYGINVKAELEGIRLNANYGVVAEEQHLPRYPGDKVSNHTTDKNWARSGMVPGSPAWDPYFAPSKEAMTQLDFEREEYYAAVQTFLSPGWNQNVAKYKEWFHHRRIVAINAKTGEGGVLAVEDAGPNPSLHRAFGASPEGMEAIGLGPIRKGNIYVFFLDDPDNTVPLGPLGGSK